MRIIAARLLAVGRGQAAAPDLRPRHRSERRRNPLRGPPDQPQPGERDFARHRRPRKGRRGDHGRKSRQRGYPRRLPAGLHGVAGQRAQRHPGALDPRIASAICCAGPQSLPIEVRRPGETRHRGLVSALQPRRQAVLQERREPQRQAGVLGQDLCPRAVAEGIADTADGPLQAGELLVLPGRTLAPDHRPDRARAGRARRS